MTWGEAYNEYLDDLGEVSVGNISWDASRVLEAMDPIAYNCGFNDWTASLECEKCGQYNFDVADDDDCEDLNICPDCLHDNDED